MHRIYSIVISIVIILLGVQCTRRQPELTIWLGGAPKEVEFWETLIDEFREKSGYDVRVVVQPTDSDQRRQGLVVSLQARQPDPDVFLMDVVWIGQFVKSDWVEPLDNYIRSSPDFKTEPFFNKVLNLVDRYDDKLYALPVNIDGGLLYYREDLLKKYGYSVPQAWDELVKCSQDIQQKEKLTNPNFNGFIWQGAQYEGLTCTFLEFISSNRGSITNNNRIELDTEPDVTALGFMQELIHKYKISPPNTFTEMKEEEVRQAFQRGNALFERNWPYAWALHQSSDSPVKGKVGIAPLPHFENGVSASTLGGWHAGISKYSDEKEKAWELLKFITSYSSQKEFALNLGWNPGREDVYNDSNVIRTMPHLPELKEVFHHAVSRPNLPYYTQISGIIQCYVNNCIAGGITPIMALKKAQEEINEVSNYYGEN